VVTAEDPTILGGLGGAVAETLSEHYPTRMKRIGLLDTFGESGPDEALLEKYGLTPHHIAEAVKELLRTYLAWGHAVKRRGPRGVKAARPLP
jgi:transketolase